MSDKTIEQRVIDIIANNLSVSEDQVKPEASFTDDLGADSLDFVELQMAFEDEFKDEVTEEIPDSEYENLKTVGDAIKFFESKANG